MPVWRRFLPRLRVPTSSIKVTDKNNHRILVHHGAIKEHVSMSFHKILKSMRYKASIAILLRIQVFLDAMPRWWISVSHHFEHTLCFHLQDFSHPTRTHSFWTAQSLSTPEDLNSQMLDTCIVFFQLMCNMMADSYTLRISISILYYKQILPMNMCKQINNRSLPSYISEWEQSDTM